MKEEKDQTKQTEKPENKQKGESGEFDFWRQLAQGLPSPGRCFRNRPAWISGFPISSVSREVLRSLLWVPNANILGKIEVSFCFIIFLACWWIFHLSLFLCPPLSNLRSLWHKWAPLCRLSRSGFKTARCSSPRILYNCLGFFPTSSNWCWLTLHRGFEFARLSALGLFPVTGLERKSISF